MAIATITNAAGVVTSYKNPSTGTWVQGSPPAGLVSSPTPAPKPSAPVASVSFGIPSTGVSLPQSKQGETVEQSQAKYAFDVASGKVAGSSAPVVVEKPVVLQTPLPGGGQRYSLATEVTTYTGLTPLEQATKQSLTQEEQAKRIAIAKTLTNPVLPSRTAENTALPQNKQAPVSRPSQIEEISNKLNEGIEKDISAAGVDWGSGRVLGPGEAIAKTIRAGAGLVVAAPLSMVVSARKKFQERVKPGRFGLIGAAKAAPGIFFETAIEGAAGFVGFGGTAVKELESGNPSRGIILVGSIFLPGKVFKEKPVASPQTKLIAFDVKRGAETMIEQRPTPPPGPKLGRPGSPFELLSKEEAMAKFEAGTPSGVIKEIHKSVSFVKQERGISAERLKVNAPETGVAFKVGKRGGEVAVKEIPEPIKLFSSRMITEQEQITRRKPLKPSSSIERIRRMEPDLVKPKPGRKLGVPSAILIGGGSGVGVKAIERTKNPYKTTSGGNVVETQKTIPGSSSVTKSSELIVPAVTTVVLVGSSILNPPGEQTSYRYREETQPKPPKQPEYRLLPGPGGNTGENRWFGKGRKSRFGRKTQYAPSTLGKLTGLKASKAEKRKTLFTGLEVRGI